MRFNHICTAGTMTELFSKVPMRRMRMPGRSSFVLNSRVLHVAQNRCVTLLPRAFGCGQSIVSPVREKPEDGVIDCSVNALPLAVWQSKQWQAYATGKDAILSV